MADEQVAVVSETKSQLDKPRVSYLESFEGWYKTLSERTDIPYNALIKSTALAAWKEAYTLGWHTGREDGKEEGYNRAYQEYQDLDMDDPLDGALW